MTQTTQKTSEEIEDLKRQWRNDPCWDIETTEGFEAHHDELLAYRQQVDAEWKQKQADDLQSFATMMGIPNNLRLAQYIISLTNQIKWLREDVEKLQ